MKKPMKRLFMSLGICIFLLALTASYWVVFGPGRYEFYLEPASKLALKLNALDTAESYANEMLKTAEKNPNDWNYGNAIHYANVILGRIALAKGNINEAKKLLIKAGKTPGSPQLNSFGPDMALAKELCKKGEKSTVIEYLELCKVFWEMSGGKLDKWKAEIQKGQVPDFED